MLVLGCGFVHPRQREGTARQESQMDQVVPRTIEIVPPINFRVTERSVGDG
jgi:hypothetical protein